MKFKLRLLEANLRENDWPELGRNETYIEIVAEGPGNKARKCWYGPEAIHDGKNVFRGVHVFVNHATESEREERPEGDADKIVGRIKETFIIKGKGGRLKLMGILKITEGKSFEKYKDLINESVKAESEGFPPILSVSINAEGKTKPQLIEGVEYNYVTGIPKAYSVDIVTKGGIKSAGFKHFMESSSDFLFPNATIEGEAKMKKKFSKEQKNRFLELQQTMLESMSDEDAEFYTECLPSLSESDEDSGNAENDSDEEDNNEEDETVVTLTLENGETIEVGEPDEYDENDCPVWILESGQKVSLDKDAQVLTEEEDEALAESDEDDFEFPEEFEELREAYPGLVARICAKENDPEKVMLKTQVALNESLRVAQKKIKESKVPAELLTAEDLVGLTESEMNRQINTVQRTKRFLESKVESRNMLPGNMHRDSFSGGNTTSVGARIAANALSDE